MPLLQKAQESLSLYIFQTFGWQEKFWKMSTDSDIWVQPHPEFSAFLKAAHDSGTGEHVLNKDMYFSPYHPAVCKAWPAQPHTCPSPRRWGGHRARWGWKPACRWWCCPGPAPQRWPSPYQTAPPLAHSRLGWEITHHAQYGTQTIRLESVDGQRWHNRMRPPHHSSSGWAHSPARWRCSSGSCSSPSPSHTSASTARPSAQCSQSQCSW